MVALALGLDDAHSPVAVILTRVRATKVLAHHRTEPLAGQPSVVSDSHGHGHAITENLVD